MRTGTAWQAHLPGQFAGTLRAVAAYLDEALATARTPDSPPGTAPGRWRLRRQACRSLSDLRAEFQRTMSEPAAISRRASAWWPAAVGLEEVMDATSPARAAEHASPLRPERGSEENNGSAEDPMLEAYRT